MNRSEAEKLLRGWGLTDRPEEFGDGIHSWRCEYPDRYGRCTCFEDCVRDLMKFMEGETE